MTTHTKYTKQKGERFNEAVGMGEISKHDSGNGNVVDAATCGGDGSGKQWGF
jgi:hypothetical protein